MPERTSRYTRYRIVPDHLIDDPSVSHVAFRLLALLDRYANYEDGATPARETLAEKLGVSLSTIQRSIKELETAGVLTVTRRKSKAGCNASNHYELHDPQATLFAEPHGVTSDQKPAGDPPPHADQQVTSDPYVGVTHDPRMKEITSPEGEVNRETVTTKARSRPRDPAWDALVAALEWTPSTTHENSRVGKAIREIRNALPEDQRTPELVAQHITARAGRYRKTWPTSELTPEALVKHWSRFAPGARIPPRPIPPSFNPARATLSQAEWLMENKHPQDMTEEERKVCLRDLSEDERLLFDSRLHQPRPHVG